MSEEIETVAVENKATGEIRPAGFSNLTKASFNELIRRKDVIKMLENEADS